MTTQGDVFQVKVFSRTGGIEQLNVFFYQVAGFISAAPGNAYNLWASINAVVLPSIATVCSTLTNIHKTEVLNLADLSDFYTNEQNISGGVTGETCSAFVAWRFVSPRPFPGLRNGYKRIGVPGEGDVVFMGATGGANTRLVATAAVFSLSLTPQFLQIMKPVIVSRPIVYGVNPPNIRNAVWSFDQVTSQSSRRF